MKRIFRFLLIAGLLAAILGACSNVPKGTPIEGAERDQVLVYAEPQVERTLLSIAANDYTAFSENMSADMLKAMDPDAFDTLRGQLDNGFGEYQSRAVDSVVDYGEFVTVFYDIKFSKKAGRMSMSFDKAEPYQIRGMYFQ